MTELSNAALSAYKNILPKLTIEDQLTDWAAAKEVDRRIIRIIMFTQRDLDPNQALILQVDMSAAQDEYVQAENKFAEVVGDEPADFKRRLKQKIDTGIVTIEGLEGESKIPDKIIMVIPADLYPEQDLGINTSSSRQALFSGEIKEFLKVESTRVTYLSINILGHFPGERLPIHPSIIEAIGIEQLDTKVNPQSTVSFKAVSE